MRSARIEISAYYDDEDVQRSGATIFFWVVLVLLICLGICVLASVILALIYGS